MQWHSVDWSQELFRISVSLHLNTLVAAVFMGTEIIKISTSPVYRMVWYTQEKYIIGIKISTRPATKNTCEDGSTI